MSMIEVRDLRVRFGATEVLRGIDLTVEKGEVVAVIGPSGSGKTTLLRCLNCLEAPCAGRIVVAGVAIDGSRPLSRQKAQVRALRRHVGFVFQNFNLFPHRTAIGNVIEGPVIVKHQSRDSAIARGRALLAQVGLAEREAAYPAQLSGGQQQRVAIARALAMEPDVILFDEPTTNVEANAKLQLIRAFKQFRHRFRQTIIYVTHDQTEAMTMGS